MKTAPLRRHASQESTVTECQFPLFGPGAQSRNRFQQPLQLRPEKYGSSTRPVRSGFHYPNRKPLGARNRGRTATLPYDCIVHRVTG